MIARNPQRLGSSSAACGVMNRRLGARRVDRSAAAAAHGALEVHLDAIDAAEKRVRVRELPLRPEHRLQSSDVLRCARAAALFSIWVGLARPRAGSATELDAPRDELQLYVYKF